MQQVSVPCIGLNKSFQWRLNLKFRKKTLATDSHNHAVDIRAVRRFFQALAKHRQINEIVSMLK